MRPFNQVKDLEMTQSSMPDFYNPRLFFTNFVALPARERERERDYASLRLRGRFRKNP